MREKRLGGVPLNAALTAQPGLRVTAKRESNGEYSIREKGGLVFYFENVAGTVPAGTRPDASVLVRQWRPPHHPDHRLGGADLPLHL
ncbi:hypothetical protein [Methylocaldum marinum]|uniref:hypothetical protein n=1 Tax=Methylocaldum marinum TaxID=1432792 RepID=UPI000E677F96|nr:hypothetical protein [Methylocaldum marinum]